MRFTLRQAQVFITTAHYQNISKAAEHLAMSQSAASGALKELENQFNIQLFDRVGKRLQTNELGRMARPMAEALLEQAHKFEQTLAEHEQVGDIKVGATLTIGNQLAISLVSEFMQQFPKGKVQLEVANTHNIAEQLLNFQLDIGLIEGEFHHPDLRIHPWQNDELVVFCSPDHPLAQKGILEDKQVLEQGWILRERGSGTRQTFDSVMRGLLPELNILLELQHTEGIKRAVSANLGISCLSHMSLEDDFQRGDLVPLAIPDRNFKRQFYLVYHRQKYLTEGLKRWITLCGFEPEELWA